MQRMSDEQLYEECLASAAWCLYEDGTRYGNTAFGVSQSCSVPISQARRVLGKLQADGWMETFWAHGEKHFKLRGDVMVERRNAV